MSGALYLGLGLVGGNAIPTKERRESMESHSYDGSAATHRNTETRQTSSAQHHEGTMEGELLLLYRKKNKKLRETLILNHSKPGRSNNREVPVFALFHEWWKNS